MKPVLDDLETDVRELLDLAAPGIEPPIQARQRIAARLAVGIAAPALGDNNPSLTERGLLSGPLTSSAAGVTRWSSHAVVAAFLTGTMTGAGGYALLQHSTLRRAAPAPVSTQQVEAPSAPEQPVGLEPFTADARSVSSVLPSAPPRPGAGRGTPRAAGLDAERTLLDVARRALAEGRGENALRPIAEHARRFPQGVLAEEREALAVNALVASARYPEARERAAEFLRRFPNSLLRSSVEAAIDAIP